jgi:threonine/homoserine/homoserine lactone efflux protein
MTITVQQALLYAGAMAALWAVPGPVWVALIARALSGGFAGAWPLAVGVTLGDAVWPLAAIFGLSWVLSVYGGFLTALHWVAVATFVIMGMLLLRKSGVPPSDGVLTRPGVWAGFATGVAAAFGNPKAILFYMGVLPGFFDLTRLTGPDIAVIIGISVWVPLIGNIALALFLDRARAMLATPERLRRMNLFSGLLLIGVGVAIALM